MAAKNFYGSQTFLNTEGKGAGKEKTIIYKFSTRESLNQWHDADMNIYASGGKQPDTRYQRQIMSAKAANKAIKEGTSVSDRSGYTPKEIKGSYAHVKHDNPKYGNDFGVVCCFKDDKQRDDFIGKHATTFKGNMAPIESTDRRAIAGNLNGAALRYGSEGRNDKDGKPIDPEKEFTSRLAMSLASYRELDPTQHKLALVGQKEGMAKPEVYRFKSVSFRDRFVKNINSSSKNLPIVADKLNSFSGIAISHAARGMILDGSLKKHFENLKGYLAINNANNKAVQGIVRQSVTGVELNKMIDSGQKEFKNLDLRGLSLPNQSYEGYSFKNCDFSSQKLDGLNFSHADLSGSSFKGSSINGSKFDSANLDKASFKDATADKSPVSFKGASLNNADFKYAKCPSSDLRDAALNRANFYKSDLNSAMTVGAKLTGTEFNAANLANAKMDTAAKTYDTASFKGSNVKGTGIETIPRIQDQAGQARSNEPSMSR